MVGTSGSTAARVLAETASGRSLPSLTSGIAGGSDVNVIGVWPATADWIAGPAPLNGTCTRSSPAKSLNNSPERCGVVPVPADAKVYLPGFFLISSISSFTFFAAIEGCTTSRFGASAATVIGWKSLYGSYGTRG